MSNKKELTVEEIEFETQYKQQDLICIKQERIRRGIECILNCLKPYTNISGKEPNKLLLVNKLFEFVKALEV